MTASRAFLPLTLAAMMALGLCACDAAVPLAGSTSDRAEEASLADIEDTPLADDAREPAESRGAEAAEPDGIAPGDAAGSETQEMAGGESEGEDGPGPAASPAPATPASADAVRATLVISEDYRASFMHGDKPAACQKYIVLHDTESEAGASDVIVYWDGSGNGVAAHFVVNKDGSIVQCVPLDTIAHHAGFGDTGHNALYGVEDESRDDKVGTTPIGGWAADYGMNSYSIGIEMVHVGGSGSYPEAQLAALDALIAYIDAYYGFPSAIIDHKAWRTGNSDTSPEFAGYLASYQDHRTHA